MDRPDKYDMTAAKYNDFDVVFWMKKDVTLFNYYAQIRNKAKQLITQIQISKGIYEGSTSLVPDCLYLHIDRSVLDTLALGTYYYDVKENSHRIIEGTFLLREGVTQLP